MVEHLTSSSFKEKVFDYEQNSEWKFKGSKPCVIDFYANWCGPCKMVSPILEQLAKEYEGKLDIYKIDTETERELATTFQIQSIPTLIFVPKEGDPQMSLGALPKESFERAFKDILNI